MYLIVGKRSGLSTLIQSKLKFFYQNVFVLLSFKVESEVVAVPLMKGGWVRDAHSQDPIQPSELDEHIEDQVLRAAPVENHRQGTEPSRRFLVDLKSGLLKNYVSEMSRRPSGCKCVCVRVSVQWL